MSSSQILQPENAEHSDYAEDMEDVEDVSIPTLFSDFIKFKSNLKFFEADILINRSFSSYCRASKPPRSNVHQKISY